MYDKITDPITNKLVNIHKSGGKQILNNYIKQLGGATYFNNLFNNGMIQLTHRGLQTMIPGLEISEDKKIITIPFLKPYESMVISFFLKDYNVIIEGFYNRVFQDQINYSLQTYGMYISQIIIYSDGKSNAETNIILKNFTSDIINKLFNIPIDVKITSKIVKMEIINFNLVSRLHIDIELLSHVLPSSSSWKSINPFKMLVEATFYVFFGVKYGFSVSDMIIEKLQLPGNTFTFENGGSIKLLNINTDSGESLKLPNSIILEMNFPIPYRDILTLINISPVDYKFNCDYLYIDNSNLDIIYDFIHEEDDDYLKIMFETLYNYI